MVEGFEVGVNSRRYWPRAVGFKIVGGGFSDNAGVGGTGSGLGAGSVPLDDRGPRGTREQQ